jgi:hypothetical protein
MPQEDVGPWCGLATTTMCQLPACPALCAAHSSEGSVLGSQGGTGTLFPELQTLAGTRKCPSPRDRTKACWTHKLVQIREVPLWVGRQPGICLAGVLVWHTTCATGLGCSIRGEMTFCPLAATSCPALPSCFHCRTVL